MLCIKVSGRVLQRIVVSPPPGVACAPIPVFPHFLSGSLCCLEPCLLGSHGPLRAISSGVAALSVRLVLGVVDLDVRTRLAPF